MAEIIYYCPSCNSKLVFQCINGDLADMGCDDGDFWCASCESIHEDVFTNESRTMTFKLRQLQAELIDKI